MQETYRPLRAFVAIHGGARMRLRPSMCDALIRLCVEEWPSGCPGDRIEEVLLARVRKRVRKRYGAVISALFVSVIAGMVVRLTCEWYRKRTSHRVLMEGWRAQANPDVSSAGDAAPE